MIASGNDSNHIRREMQENGKDAKGLVIQTNLDAYEAGQRKRFAQNNKIRYIVRFKDSKDGKPNDKRSRVEVVDLSKDELVLLKSRGDIEAIDDDMIVKGSVDTDSWALDRIDQVAGFDGNYNPQTSLSGAGITLYIVDSGVSASHTEFSNGNRVEFGINFADDATGKYSQLAKEKYGDTNLVNYGANIDCSSHGTHVGSLAAGKTVGIAKNAKIVPVRSLDCTTDGYLSDIIKGIKWSTADALKRSNGAKPKAVINLSLTSRYSASLNIAVEEAVDAGMVVVTSAGNDRDNACNYSPGSSKSAITVGGINKDDSLYVNSNYGSDCIDIFAPAVLTKGASNTDDTGYIYLTGTSMASPIVAGVASLLLERGVPSDRVKSELETKSTKAVRNTDSDCSGFPNPDRVVQLPKATTGESPILDVPEFQADGQDFTIWKEDYSIFAANVTATVRGATGSDNGSNNSTSKDGNSTIVTAPYEKADICFIFEMGSTVGNANKGARIAISSEVFPLGYKSFLASRKKFATNTKCGSQAGKEISPTVFFLSLFPKRQSLILGYGDRSGVPSAFSKFRAMQPGSIYWIRTENKSGRLLFGIGNNPLKGTPILTTSWAVDKSKPLRFLSLSSTPKTKLLFKNIQVTGC